MIRLGVFSALIVTMMPGGLAAAAVPMAMTSGQALSAIRSADGAIIELVTPRPGVDTTQHVRWQRRVQVLLWHRVSRDWTTRFAHQLERVGIYSRFTRCAPDDSSGDEPRPRFQVLMGDSSDSTWVWLDFAQRCAELGSASRPGGIIPLDFGPERLLALLTEGLGVSDSAEAAIEESAKKRTHVHAGDRGEHKLVAVETLPEVISQVPPKYPFEARLAEVHGMVQLQALVDRSGVVADLFVRNSIPMLDAAAVESVRQWKFKPATSNGKPVAVWVLVPVKFTLR